MAAILEHLPSGRIVRRWMKGGEAGNLQTMALIRAIIRYNYLGLDGGTLDRDVADKAAEIYNEAGVASHDWQGTIQAVHDYTINNIHYVQDPAGGNESIEHPLFALKRGFADCDGLVTFELTMLAMLGFNVGLEAARYTPDIIGYEHLYGYVETPTADRAILYLDPTAFDEPPGWYDENALQRARLDVTGSNESFEFAGLLDVLGYAADVGGAFFGVPGAGVPFHLMDAKKRATATAHLANLTEFEQVDKQSNEIMLALEAQVRAGTITKTEALAECDSILSTWNNLKGRFTEQGDYYNHVNTNITSAVARIRSEAAMLSDTVAGEGVVASTLSSINITGNPATDKVIVYGAGAVAALFVADKLFS